MKTNRQTCRAALLEARRIEAYGVKGMKSTTWRKTFKDAAAMLAWCEKNDAVVHGQRGGVA